METHFLGVVIRPHAHYPNSTALTLVMHVDIKGWLPRFVANRYMAKAPKNWHALLSNYYWNDYSKHRRWDKKTARSGDTDDEVVNDANVAESGRKTNLSGLHHPYKDNLKKLNYKIFTSYIIIYYR